MQIDKETVVSFRKDFAACVADLEKKYGVTIRVGAIRYTAAEFHGKMSVKSNDPEALQVEAASKNNFLISKCISWGVSTKPTGLIGSTYSYDGKRYTITDYVSHRRKNPIIATCLNDSKSYVLPWAYLKMMKLEV